MVCDKVVINKLKIITVIVGIIIGSFGGALVLEKIDPSYLGNTCLYD